MVLTENRQFTEKVPFEHPKKARELTMQISVGKALLKERTASAKISVTGLKSSRTAKRSVCL